MINTTEFLTHLAPHLCQAKKHTRAYANERIVRLRKIVPERSKQGPDNDRIMRKHTQKVIPV